MSKTATIFKAVNTSSETLATTFIVSVFFHFLTMWVLVKFVPSSNLAARTNVEIVYQNETKDKNAKELKRTFVKATEVPEDLLKPEEPQHPADYLATKSQRVREQMKATKSGPTQNAMSPSKPQLKKRDLLQLGKASPFKDLTESSEDGPAFSRKSSNESFASQLSRYQEATVNEILPDEVKAGNMTVLNTDRHLFASFYDRFSDLTRYRWLRHLRREYYNGIRQNAQFSAGTTYSTILEVIVDRQGFLKQIVVRQSAGFPGFDRAALESVKEVQQFPNPPPEMVQDDGRIHIYAQYMFILH